MTSYEIAKDITVALLQRTGDIPSGVLLGKSEELGKAAGKIYQEVHKVVVACVQGVK